MARGAWHARRDVATLCRSAARLSRHTTRALRLLDTELLGGKPIAALLKQLGEEIARSRVQLTTRVVPVDRYGGTNRKYREHCRYSEKNEKRFFFHGSADARISATSGSLIGVTRVFSPRLGAALAPSSRNTKFWQ